MRKLILILLCLIPTLAMATGRETLQPIDGKLPKITVMCDLPGLKNLENPWYVSFKMDDVYILSLKHGKVYVPRDKCVIFVADPK